MTRLGRLVSYFTIQSNLLVAVTAVQLARDPLRDGRWWRAVRVAAVVGITVTGLVHFVLLRPLLDLEGASWVADKLLHMVVPVVAVLGWLRRRAAPARPLARRPPGPACGPSPGSAGPSSSAASPAGTRTRSSTSAPRGPPRSP